MNGRSGPFAIFVTFTTAIRARNRIIAKVIGKLELAGINSAEMGEAGLGILKELVRSGLNSCIISSIKNVSNRRDSIFSISIG